MKRIISAVCAVLMLATATACGDGTPQASPENNYRIGMASYTHTNDTYGYTEGKNGQSAVSTTYVAAVFDRDGKIVKIKIDEVESRTAFDATGQLAGYEGGEIISKKELGDNYGMKSASSIGKEWHEQVETLEKWLEGKKVTMLSSTARNALNDSGNSTDSYSTYDKQMMPRATDGGSGSTVTGNSVMDGTVTGDVMDGVNDVIDNMTDGNNTDSTDNTYSSSSSAWMDEDLRAGVTIDTTYMVKAIEKAYRNAK